MTDTSQLQELTNEISSILVGNEVRKARSADPKSRFDYAVKYILTDLWKASKSIPARECLMSLRSGYYSENKRYRDPNLTYKQVIAVFEGLKDAGFIEITKDGYLDRATGTGSLTKYIARDGLLEMLNGLEGHPAIEVKPDVDRETIILRDTIDGKRTQVKYEETPKTEEYRANLLTINRCFSKHWPDLKIKDTEIAALQDRLNRDDDKLPIDLSKRTLDRIFSNGSFKEGGRFYRVWWQNVPSKYRKYITLDAKQTVEYDFSQLNPHMLYYAYNFKLGSEDAYDRVLDGEHRGVVKQAFNAMLQADTELLTKPSGINMDGLDMSWRELRERVLDSHKTIQHLFFKGTGNKLQFEDSRIAESVMLHFAAMDAPALPVHDSFIMHHGYGGELEEAMRRAFYDRFGGDIPIKEEVIVEMTAKDIEEQPEMTSDEIIKGEVEYSHWQDRDNMWWASR